MSLNLTVLYQPNDNPEAPLVWFPLAHIVGNEREALQGDFDAFHQWLAMALSQAQGASGVNLYLLLAQELVGLHHVDVPDGVKRNLQKLLPVLLEEQLAQDIDQIGAHYVPEMTNASGGQTEQDGDAALSSEPASFIPNAAVWDAAALQQLVVALKTAPAADAPDARIRLKACLPVSAVAGMSVYQDDSALMAFRDLLPPVPEHHQLALPALAGEQSGLLLEAHPWNLVVPEQSEISPLYPLTALGLIAAGLYLLNQWLSVA